MEKPRTRTSTIKIFRRSIYTFLQNYQYFTLISSLLAFPFSISLLISQSFISSSISFLPIYNHLRILFDAAGFPSSELFNIFSQKLSQTISCSILSLPFTLSFFLITKASVIQALNAQKPKFQPSFSSIIALYNPLVYTHICNSVLIISANATVFSLLFFGFNCLEGLRSSSNYIFFVSVASAILYSVVIANALIICNLALVLSGMDKRFGGYLAILKACVLIRGRSSAALSLALPVNLAMAGVEALFQYRVVSAFYWRVGEEKAGCFMAFEGIFIGYLYSVLVVIDTIVNSLFCRSCEMDLEGRKDCLLDFEEGEENGGVIMNLKNSEGFA